MELFETIVWILLGFYISILLFKSYFQGIYNAFKKDFKSWGWSFETLSFTEKEMKDLERSFKPLKPTGSSCTAHIHGGIVNRYKNLCGSCIEKNKCERYAMLKKCDIQSVYECDKYQDKREIQKQEYYGNQKTINNYHEFTLDELRFIFSSIKATNSDTKCFIPVLIKKTIITKIVNQIKFLEHLINKS